MKILHWHVTHKLSGFLLFAAGLIVSAAVSSAIERTIALSEAIFFVSITVLIVAAIYYFRAATARIETLANGAELSVRYVEEVLRQADGIKFRGLVYKELQRLVEDSRFEILNLSSGFQIADQPTRKGYLRAIQVKLKEGQYAGFKYVRINQVPPQAASIDPCKALSDETRAHCARALEIGTLSTTNKLTVAVMQAPMKRQASFLLIDRRHVVLQVDGVDERGNPYPMGMFFMEDRGGRLVEHFLRLFEELERLASPIAQRQLIEAAPSSQSGC